jgi:hypothetical protein
MTALSAALIAVGAALLIRLSIGVLMRKLRVEPADASARSWGLKDVVDRLARRRARE